MNITSINVSYEHAIAVLEARKSNTRKKVRSVLSSAKQREKKKKNIVKCFEC